MIAVLSWIATLWRTLTTVSTVSQNSYRPTFDCLEGRITPAAPKLKMMQWTNQAAEYRPTAVLGLWPKKPGPITFMVVGNFDGEVTETVTNRGRVVSVQSQHVTGGGFFTLRVPRVKKGGVDVGITVTNETCGAWWLKVVGGAPRRSFDFSTPCPPITAVPAVPPYVPPPDNPSAQPHQLSADGLFFRIDNPGSGQELAQISVGIGPATFNRLVLTLGTGDWHDIANVALRVYGSLPSDPTLGTTYLINGLGDTLTIDGISFTIPSDSQQFSVIVDAGVGAVPLQVNGVAAYSA